eukprot:gene22939-35162_t
MSAWALLVVGGTPGEVYGHEKRPWTDPGQQVSFLQTLGLVYDNLVQTLGKDRIIVVAGVRMVVEWLERAEALGHPPCEPEHLEFCKKHTRVETPERLAEQKKLYRDRREGVLAACSALLANGGPDYDFERLTPETVLSILSGEPARETDRVLPKSGVSSCFVWLTSHGGHHPVAVGDEVCEEGADEKEKEKGEQALTCFDGKRPLRINVADRVCDVCGSPHDAGKEYDHEHSSLKTREWFMLMPFRSTDAAKYGAVTTAGRDMRCAAVTDVKDLSVVSPLTCLYWQQVVSSIAAPCAAGTKFVMLYQFCTSGGHCKWLTDPAYLRYLSVNEWPVFQMATSKEQQYSLGATFTTTFMSCLSNTIARDGTLGDAYAEAERIYWQQHQVEAGMNARAVTPSLRFGELVVAEGSRLSQSKVRSLFCNVDTAST